MEGQGSNTEECLKESQKTFDKPTENTFYIYIVKVEKEKREKEGGRDGESKTEGGERGRSRERI